MAGTYRYDRLCVAFLFLLILAGCGGGGGNSAPTGGTADQIPIAVAITMTVDQNTSQVLDLSAQNGVVLGNAPAVIGIVTAPTQGSASLSGSSITYTPNADFVGSDSLEYRITDADGQVSNATVSITVRDAVAPTVRILFPSSGNALTETETILIKGTASDVHSAITAVRVGGVDAVTTDGYATWSARVPLTPGDNTIVIETSDAAGNVDMQAASSMVRYRGALIGDAVSMVVDGANDRALIVDAFGRLLSLDLTSGFRRVVSPMDGVNRIVMGMALDPVRNRVLGLGGSSVVAVDLTTGARSVLSGGDIPDNNNPFGFTESITLDAAHGRALVLDSGNNSVIAVDLLTGARTVLSDNTNTGVPFSSSVQDVALDTVNGNRVLVLQAGALIAVDLATGTRSVLSDNTTPNSRNPFSSFNNDTSMVMDPANNRVLVMDRDENDPSGTSGHVLSVDLTTGDRTVVSDRVIPDNDNSLPTNPWDMSLDTDRNRLLISTRSTNGPGKIISVDLATGKRATEYALSLPDSNVPISGIGGGIAIDSATDRLFIGQGGDGLVTAVDLLTGSRSVLTDAASISGLPSLNRVEDVEVDPASGRLFVLGLTINGGKFSGAIFEENLLSGTRSLFSSATYPDGVLPLTDSRRFALDAAHNRLLVTEAPIWTAGGQPRIVSVDLSTGGRSIFSDNSMAPGSALQWSYPAAIAIDSTNGQAIVADSGSLVAVDLVTGARRVVSDDKTPNGNNPLADIFDVVVNRSGTEAYVSNGYFGQILAVSLDTGARRIVLDENQLLNPASTGYMALDEPNNRLLMLNRGFNAIMAVDIETGERAFVSR